jgi:hypothetical protein
MGATPAKTRMTADAVQVVGKAYPAHWGRMKERSTVTNLRKLGRIVIVVALFAMLLNTALAAAGRWG